MVEEVPATLTLTTSATANWALSMTMCAVVRDLHTHTENRSRQQATTHTVYAAWISMDKYEAAGTLQR